jgi:hypothetical protein
MIYEYDKDHFNTILPHIILLTSQFNQGHNGSMLRGELTVILTAMRNRANQTVNHEEEQQQEEEEPEKAKKESELMFKNEDRFPVRVYEISEIPWTKFLTNAFWSTRF